MQLLNNSTLASVCLAWSVMVVMMFTTTSSISRLLRSYKRQMEFYLQWLQIKYTLRIARRHKTWIQSPPVTVIASMVCKKELKSAVELTFMAKASQILTSLMWNKLLLLRSGCLELTKDCLEFQSVKTLSISRWPMAPILISYLPLITCMLLAAHLLYTAQFPISWICRILLQLVSYGLTQRGLL